MDSISYIQHRCHWIGQCIICFCCEWFHFSFFVGTVFWNCYFYLFRVYLLQWVLLPEIIAQEDHVLCCQKMLNYESIMYSRDNHWCIYDIELDIIWCIGILHLCGQHKTLLLQYAKASLSLDDYQCLHSNSCSHSIPLYAQPIL